MKFKVWIACLSISVLAGFPGAVSAQSEDEAVEEAKRRLDTLAAEVQEIAGGVRFDEADVESVIELWPEFDEFGQMMDTEDEDESMEFKAILADPKYRQWASSHGLDPEDWMRKTVRIMMTLYRDQTLQSIALAPQQIQEQMEMIEQQRDQVGDELYQQMKQALESSAALSKYMEEAVRKMPEATAAEEAVLDKYREELMMLMMSDEDDDEYGYEEDYEDEEEWK